MKDSFTVPFYLLGFSCFVLFLTFSSEVSLDKHVSSVKENLSKKFGNFVRTNALELRNSLLSTTMTSYTSTSAASPPVELMTSPANVTQLRVLLQTSYRSGSSFVGEFLGQNPDAFYAFEPLYFIRNNRSSREEKREALMDFLFRCNVTSLERFGRGKDTKRSYKFWIKKAFSSENFTEAQRKCEQSRDVMVKTIRIELLNETLPRFKEEGGVVLYMLRDPRGVIGSRVHLHGDIYSQRWVNNAKQLCNQHLTNLKFLRTSLSSDGRFIYEKMFALLRYEEFAVRPIEMANKLYDFLGRKVPQKLLNFIGNSTQVTKGNAYSTKRNSLDTYQQWRTHLPFDVVREIQGVCRGSMEALGYKMVTRRTMKQLDSNLLLPMSPDTHSL